MFPFPNKVVASFKHRKINIIQSSLALNYNKMTNMGLFLVASSLKTYFSGKCPGPYVTKLSCTGKKSVELFYFQILTYSVATIPRW